MLLNNRFKVIKQLSQGGFGETFLAEDTHMPSQRRCVIKQLRPEVPNQKCYDIALRKFQEEAAILEELDHPQIPRLYGYFEQEGQFYLSQQWIDGQTLGEKVILDGPMPESEVVSTLIRLLPVFEYLHAHKVVHRDVKPDNIMVRRRDSLPVLIDFGSVKQHLRTTMSPSGGFTCSVMIGTEGFAAPEQSAQRIVYSSDLYGLGITSIYLLTGKLPQEIDKDPQTGQILWHDLVPAVSPEFKAVVDKSTEFSPRDRYFSAEEMLQSLRAIAPEVDLIMAPIVTSQIGIPQSSVNSGAPASAPLPSAPLPTVVSNTHAQAVAPTAIEPETYDQNVAAATAAENSSATEVQIGASAMMPNSQTQGISQGSIAGPISQGSIGQGPNSQNTVYQGPISQELQGSQIYDGAVNASPIKPILNRNSSLGATVIDPSGVPELESQRPRKLLFGIAGLALAASSVFAFYLGSALDGKVPSGATAQTQTQTQPGPEEMMAQKVAQYKKEGKLQMAINKSFEFMELGFSPDSEAGKDILGQFADMTVLPLGKELDQVLDVQNYPNPPGKPKKRSLAGFGASGLSDVDNRTRSKKLQTALGISPVNVYPGVFGLPVTWPKYERQPAPNQWTKVTAASWKDPWRETYAFENMELRVLYGCMTNLVLQNTAVFKRDAKLPFMQAWLKEVVPSISESEMEKLDAKLVGIYEGNRDSDKSFTTVDGNVQVMIMKDKGEMVIASRIV